LINRVGKEIKLFKSWKIFALIIAGFALQACASASSPAIAGTRVVVSGEDSNRNSVARTAEVYKAVVTEIKEALGREGYDVIDEDLLAVEADFKFQSRRPKTDLIRTLKIANEDGNAKIKSRLAVIFSIFPQIKQLSIAKRIESVRIRGDIYDLASLQSLSSFKVRAKTKKILPSNCDDFCISEILVDVVEDLALDLGDTLVQKLAIATESIGGNSKTANETSGGGLIRVFNLELIRFKFKQAKALKNSLLNVKGIIRVEMNTSSGSKREYSVDTLLNMGNIEESIYMALEKAGISDEAVKVSISTDKVRIQNLAR